MFYNFCPCGNFDDIGVEFKSFGNKKRQLTIATALPTVLPLKHWHLWPLIRQYAFLPLC